MESLMKAKFVLQKSKVLEQYDLLKECCDEVSYSLKSNPIVGEVLEEGSDCSFSVHSIESLKVLKYVKRVYYFSQAWSEEDLDQLFSLGVRKFVVDNKQDLDVLLKFIEGREDKIVLFLRMRLKERTVRTGKHFVFGFYSSEVNELVPKLVVNPNIESVGVHFHRKTQNIHEWSLQYELKDSLSEETLRSIKALNIGGGLPVRYKNSRDRLEHIFGEIDKLRSWLRKYSIEVIAEPGRFIAAPGVSLHAEVISVDRNTLTVNASVYNAAMDTFIANVRMEVESEIEEGEAYILKGCTPDSLDIFRYRVYLDNPMVGDILVFKNAGAYNFHSDFCFLEKIETEVVE
jgi:ornithine decarboxylase